MTLHRLSAAAAALALSASICTTLAGQAAAQDVNDAPLTERLGSDRMGA
jgi:hypothetical protein